MKVETILTATTGKDIRQAIYGLAETHESRIRMLSICAMIQGAAIISIGVALILLKQ